MTSVTKPPAAHPREALADYLATVLDPEDERNTRDKRSGGLGGNEIVESK